MDVVATAVEIVKILQNAGYIAYFAGGWVRDFIMKHPSTDIDIATDAPPEKIMELFPRTVPVGLAFGVVIVIRNGHHFEVASFRKDLEYTGGRRPDKIEFSSPKEDALRRDFTINGMFYDPINDKVYDYVNGMEDIENGVIRTIGNAHDRFDEDRLRMIRAIRFASRFNFSIDPETQKAILLKAHTLLPAVAIERVWQELNKMAKFPRFDQAIVHMHQSGLLPIIFPHLENVSVEEIQERVANFPLFPEGLPAILYLLELFPEMSINELLEVCQYLKTSLHEGKMLEFAYKGKKLLEKEKLFPDAIEKIEWANFYADKFFHTCFDIITVSYPEEERNAIIEAHEDRRTKLFPHIQRIMEKKPLVTSAVLQDYGIKPGKTMGVLLREAERVSMHHDIHDPAEVITLLKETSLWPK